jgi:arylsulfatase A-like enzyme
LKDLGYATHAIGKWHLGYCRKEYLPTYRGFDTHYGYWNGAQDYYSHSYQEGDKFGLDFRDNLNVVFNESGNYATDLFTNRTLQIISNHDKCKPLFLYLAFPNVHAANEGQPLQAPQRFVDRFNYIPNKDRRIFAGNAYALDESVGKIFKRLFDKKLLENCIFFFLSDNGAAFSGFMG